MQEHCHVSNYMFATFLWVCVAGFVLHMTLYMLQWVCTFTCALEINPRAWWAEEGEFEYMGTL